MTFTNYKVTFHIPYTEGLFFEETSTTVISVPDYILDADDDRPANMPEAHTPLNIHLTEQLHSSIGGHAQLASYELAAEDGVGSAWYAAKQ